MKPILELFKPKAPDESYLSPLVELVDAESQSIRHLRLFNVISDLSFIKPWLRDPDRRTNWKDPSIRAPILRYQELLNGYFTQSFMILTEGRHLVQLDLSLIRKTLGFFSYTGNSKEALISYLYTRQHRNPLIFVQALELLSLYFFSFDESDSLLLFIPLAETDTYKDAILAGFNEIRWTEKSTKGLSAHQITRSQFETRLIRYPAS